MAKIDDPVVVEMPGASVSPDGSYVEMQLKNSDGTFQTLRFSPDTMMQFLAKVFETFLYQKIQRESKVGHAVVRPLEVSTTMAQEAVGGRAVILQFRLLSGIPSSFAIEVGEAEELHRQLGQAVRKAKEQVLTTRH